jgi:hypothetical protein
MKNKSMKKKSMKKKSMKKKSMKKKSMKKKSMKNINGNIMDDIYTQLFADKHIRNTGIKLMENTYNNKYEPFIKLDDIDNKLRYSYEKNTKTMGLHIGQRKLLLSEVQFLTNNIQKYCIYPGSAPSHKTHFLSKLFPDIKFILIDPNIFEIKLVENNKIFRYEQHDDITMLYYGFPTKSHVYKTKEFSHTNKVIENMNSNEIDHMIDFIKKSKHKIYVIEDYMTDKIAEILKKLGSCTFISDIRSNVTNEYVTDFDVIWNRSMVHNWISILQPEVSMIKFRIPYYNKKEDFSKYTFAVKSFETSKKYNIDFIQDYKDRIFKMSKATLFLQAWAGGSSTEMRGVIKKKDINNIIEYNTNEIEDTLFYYNKIMRVNFHVNKFANKELHFCHCNDCAIESIIWQNYIKNIGNKNKNFGKSNDIIYYIKLTDRITSRPLSIKHTQTIFEPMSYDILKSLLNRKNYSTLYVTTKYDTNKGNTGLKIK